MASHDSSTSDNISKDSRQQVPPAKTRISNQAPRGQAGKGIPELSHVRLEHGGPLSVIRRRTTHGDPIPAESLQAALEFIDFDTCPICLSSKANSREHVPPASTGGSALTFTCEPCNNIFGSRYEPALQDWYHDTSRGVRFSGEAVPGSRNVGRILVREAENGQPVLVIDGGAPGVRELLKSGNLQIEMVHTRGYELRVAALKTAYLTYCLLIGKIPRTTDADAVREILMAARELPKGVSPEPTGILASLDLRKSGHDPHPGEVHIVAVRDHEDEVRYRLLFNRFWSVSWPLRIHGIVRSDGRDHYMLGANLPLRTGH